MKELINSIFTLKWTLKQETGVDVLKEIRLTKHGMWLLREQAALKTRAFDPESLAFKISDQDLFICGIRIKEVEE